MQVVLFGDNVPAARVEMAMSTVQGADAMLVVGSSLMVLSAFRLARYANSPVPYGQYVRVLLLLNRLKENAAYPACLQSCS